MSKELPPELRPRAMPENRMGVLDRARGELEELSFCDDDFVVLRLHSDGMISSHGSVGGDRACRPVLLLGWWLNPRGDVVAVEVATFTSARQPYEVGSFPLPPAAPLRDAPALFEKEVARG